MAEELSGLVTKRTSDFEQKGREARRIKERELLERDEAQGAEKLRQDKVAEEMEAERAKGMEDILSSPPETRKAGVEEAIGGEAVSAGEPEAPPVPTDVAPEEAAEDAVAQTSEMFGPSGPVEKMTLQQLRQRARAAKRPVRQLMRTATQENMPVIKDLAEKAVEAKKDVTDMKTAKRGVRRAMRGKGMPNVFDAAKAAMAMQGAEDAAGSGAPAEAPEAASGELPTEFGSGEYNYVQTSPTSVDIYRGGKRIASSIEGDKYYAAIQRERGQELFQGAGGPDRPDIDTGSEYYDQLLRGSSAAAGLFGGDGQEEEITPASEVIGAGRAETAEDVAPGEGIGYPVGPKTVQVARDEITKIMGADMFDQLVTPQGSIDRAAFNALVRQDEIHQDDADRLIDMLRQMQFKDDREVGRHRVQYGDYGLD